MSQISAYNSSFFFINIVMLSYKYPSWNTVYNFWQPYINEMGVKDFFIIDPSCRLYALTTWKIFSKIILQHLLYNRIFSSLDLSWIRNGVYYSERNVCMRVSPICCMPPTSDPLNHCHFFFVLWIMTIFKDIKVLVKNECLLTIDWIG